MQTDLTQEQLGLIPAITTILDAMCPHLYEIADESWLPGTIGLLPSLLEVLEERRQQAKDARRQAEEEAKRHAEEERRRAEEEERRQAKEEERRHVEEEARQQVKEARHESKLLSPKPLSPKPLSPKPPTSLTSGQAHSRKR
jgi:sRNA-binding protein